eukprot:jgi/Chlat1/1577/Chrsp123S01850
MATVVAAAVRVSRSSSSLSSLSSLVATPASTLRSRQARRAPRKHQQLSVRAMASTREKQEEGQQQENKKPSGPTHYQVAPAEYINFGTSAFQALARGGLGAFVLPETASGVNNPPKPIELYEFEGYVREAVTVLNIDAIFYPCPKGGPTFRPRAVQLGGKAQFPFMIDPNNDNYQSYESDKIINYLYGRGASVPLLLKLGPLTTLSAGLALAPRAGRGSAYKPSKLPEKPLELWAYEASPFCKMVREVLSSYEIPHKYITVARNSKKREEIINKFGFFQVPLLYDPNTGAEMFESKDINQYLERTYGK